jgi:hypothetical protein
MEDKVNINTDDVELIIDGEKYYKIGKYYFKPNGFIKPIIERIIDNSNKIEKMLYTCPAFIEVVKSTIPSEMYKVVLSGEEKLKLATGSVKLMTTSDGKLLANLINTKTGKIISNVKLDKISLTPELNKAIINYSNQIQLAQIAEDIRYVQLAVEEVREGQENDRLAIAYSCKQKLLQAMQIEDHNLKKIALLNLVSSAEDNRNKLMLSQTSNVKLLKEQPKDFWGKFLKGEKEDLKKDKRIAELRENMNALNLVSLAETLAYQELGEHKAANIALQYFGDYINKTYLSDKAFIERLDSLNPSPKKYWSTMLPSISDKIKQLDIDEKKLLEEVLPNEEK